MAVQYSKSSVPKDHPLFKRKRWIVGYSRNGGNVGGMGCDPEDDLAEALGARGVPCVVHNAPVGGDVMGFVMVPDLPKRWLRVEFYLNRYEIAHTGFKDKHGFTRRHGKITRCRTPEAAADLIAELWAEYGERITPRDWRDIADEPFNVKRYPPEDYLPKEQP